MKDWTAKKWQEEDLQWPCTSKDHPGTEIMHVGKFARGLGYFRPAAYTPSMELPDEEYPTDHDDWTYSVSL